MFFFVAAHEEGQFLTAKAVGEVGFTRGSRTFGPWSAGGDLDAWGHSCGDSHGFLCHCPETFGQ